MPLNEMLAVIQLGMTAILLSRGIGVWQGRRESTEADLSGRIRSLSETVKELADHARHCIHRSEFEQESKRIDRLEDRVFRSRGQV